MNIEDLNNEIQRLAAIIGAGRYQVPSVGKRNKRSPAYLLLNENTVQYWHYGRVDVYPADTLEDLEPLFYSIFADAADSLALRHVMRNRRPKGDIRRTIYGIEIALLAKISPIWAERRLNGLERVLAQYPFRDRPVKGGPVVESRTFTCEDVEKYR